ncbi:MAG: hypothetical protein HDS65_08045 [Bacteroidales bacterium]|nr:hypothetical protein [Bacteroidales bacterium]
MKINLYHSFTAAVLGLLSLISAGCSDSEQFRVNGTIEGKPTLNLRANYYSNGAFRSIITACRDGEFEFFASSDNPVILEITDYEYHPMARLLVRNGETYKVEMTQGDRFASKTSGSDINSRWSGLVSGNADSLRLSPNNFIAHYIGSHPDDMLSTILLVTEYNAAADPEQADSLLALIAPEARPSSLTDGFNHLLSRLVSESAEAPVKPFAYVAHNDTLKTFPAAGKLNLLSLSTTDNNRDSIVSSLRRLHRNRSRLQLSLTDIILDHDTIEAWRGVRSDSAAWQQGWLPGVTANPALDPLGIPSLPYFIVCDSTGTQLMRTSRISEAEEYINNHSAR